MGKKRVGVDNLESFMGKDSGAFYMDGSVILTPGAKDELSRRGIAIIYGPRPESDDHAPAACGEGDCGAESGAERLALAVAGILQERYGITDPEQLRKLSCHVVETIRENV